MDTTRPNLIYHQKNPLLKNFLMAKSTFLKKTQKASLKVLVLERNLLSRQPHLQVTAMMAITTDTEGLLCHHRRNQLHLTTFIAVQLILTLTVVVEMAVQVLLKHQASSIHLYRASDTCRSQKKSQISRDFQGQNRGKIGRFHRNFRGKLGGKAIGKKDGGFCGYFQGKSCQKPIGFAPIRPAFLMFF